MRIEPWMKHPVTTVRPHDSARQARALMEKQRINQLPVVVDDRLVGIVTDRDLRDVFPSVFESQEPWGNRERKSGSDPATIPVEDVMTRNVLAFPPGFRCRRRASHATRAYRRDPIVDGERLVGILTRSDVLDAFVELNESALSMG